MQPGKWKKARIHILICISESNSSFRSQCYICKLDYIKNYTGVDIRHQGSRWGHEGSACFACGVISPDVTLEENNSAWGSLPSAKTITFLPLCLNHQRAPLSCLPLPLPPPPPTSALSGRSLVTTSRSTAGCSHSDLTVEQLSLGWRLLRLPGALGVSQKYDL